MARTGSETTPTPADHQQMDRSNDPELTRAMDEAAPEAAMASRRQRLTGSAEGVGNVGFTEDGVFEIAPEDGDRQDGPVTGAPSGEAP